MFLKLHKNLLVFTMLLCFAGKAYAAPSMQISGISNFSLGSWGMGDPAISAYMDVCIYSGGNSPSASYAINVSSTGGFKLINGSRSINYTLYWEDSGAGNLGSSGGTQLSSGVTLTGRQNANTSGINPLCLVTGPTARLKIKITQAEMSAALAGTYNGVITLLLSPN